jgi:molecular chaperone Hsp33
MDGDRQGAQGTGTEKFSDYVLPFQLEASGARGRLVRLGPAVDEILTRHAYPEPVLRLLGEAVALTGLLGSSLKFDGRFTLQTQSDGPVSFLVVQYTSPGHMRGYAGFNREEVTKAQNGSAVAALLGEGHLAMTIDPGAEMERYQGIVPLAGGGLADAAHEYFARSEQIPTFIRIAVARHYGGPEGGEGGKWGWRAGGLMVQKLTGEGGHFAGAGPSHAAAEDEDSWRRAMALAATVEDHELLDPALAPERLLYRLFHEETVRAFAAVPLAARCNCSRERVEAMLGRFSQEELASIVQDGIIAVSCEFCNGHYQFDADRYLKRKGS